MIVQSALGNYIATLDKGNEQIYVTKINTTPGTPYNTFVSATTMGFPFFTTINSICFSDDLYLVVHTGEGEIFFLDLRNDLSVTDIFFTIYLTSDRMFYDSASQLAILESSSSPAQTTITQISFLDFVNYQTTITAQHHLYQKGALLYMGNTNTLISIMIKTCSYTYDHLTLSCNHNTSTAANSTNLCVTEDYPGYCSVCISGYYTNLYTYETMQFQECFPCPQNCLLCSNNVTCLTCVSGYSFSNTTLICEIAT